MHLAKLLVIKIIMQLNNLESLLCNSQIYYWYRLKTSTGANRRGKKRWVARESNAGHGARNGLGYH